MNKDKNDVELNVMLTGNDIVIPVLFSLTAIFICHFTCINNILSSLNYMV